MSVAVEAPRAVVLRGDDNVAVAARPIPRGFVLHLGGRTVEVREPIGLGHKVALADIAAGRAGPQVRPDHRLRLAGRSPAGSLVHVHNLKADLFERDYAFAVRAARPSPRPDRPARSGAILRPDGRVGTRNYVAVISTVNCSASTSRYIADRFRDGAWRRGFPQRRRRLRRSPTRAAAACRSRGPTTRSSSACWPASPIIPTWRRM